MSQILNSFITDILKKFLLFKVNNVSLRLLAESIKSGSDIYVNTFLLAYL